MRRAGEEPAGPRPLRESLSEVSAELGLGAPDTFAGIVAHWPELVGPELAAHTRPRSIRDGMLTVEVDDAPWATRLRYLESQVVERVADLVAVGAVTGMRGVVATGSGTRARPPE